MEKTSYLKRSFWLLEKNKVADDFTEDEKTLRVFVNNIPGRHFIVRLAKDAWKIAFPDPYFRPKVDYIVFRGKTLKRITQKHNKAVLSATSGRL